MINKEQILLRELKKSKEFLNDLIFEFNDTKSSNYFNDWIENQLLDSPIHPTPVLGVNSMQIIIEACYLFRKYEPAYQLKFEQSIFQVFNKYLPDETNNFVRTDILDKLIGIISKLKLTQYTNALSDIIRYETLLGYQLGKSRDLHFVLLDTFIAWSAGNTEDEIYENKKITEYIKEGIDKYKDARFTFIASRYFIYRNFQPVQYFDLLSSGLPYFDAKNSDYLLYSLQELFLCRKAELFPYQEFESWLLNAIENKKIENTFINEINSFLYEELDKIEITKQNPHIRTLTLIAFCLGKEYCNNLYDKIGDDYFEFGVKILQDYNTFYAKKALSIIPDEIETNNIYVEILTTQINLLQTAQYKNIDFIPPVNLSYPKKANNLIDLLHDYAKEVLFSPTYYFGNIQYEWEVDYSSKILKLQSIKKRESFRASVSDILNQVKATESKEATISDKLYNNQQKRHPLRIIS